MAAGTFDNFTTPNERAISGAMAVVTHLLFFALLVFGVSWQKRQPPEAMVVDLWNNLPPIAAPKAEPTPEVKPEPPAPKPDPVVKPEAKPVPKAETKPAPKPETKPTVKPDIALQDKKAKERKAAEEAQEKKKREQEEALRKLAGQQAKEAEAKSQAAAREQEDALKKQAAQQAASLDKQRAEYVERIRARIKKFIVEPPGLTGNPEVQFEITVFADGNVPGVRTKKPSGQTAWDNAVERAILRAQPLPVPPSDSPLAKDFRELSPVFRLKE